MMYDKKVCMRVGKWMAQISYELVNIDICGALHFECILGDKIC